ncbi:MAG: pyrroline-5-carboxylate reductase [Rhodobacteraceae bacterium]|nr:pyrroline-5-carboxylate reductase [Paracoccaceae bacterium]
MNIENAIVLVGCGKMGSAILEGWLGQGVSAKKLWILEPRPSDRLIELQNSGLHLNQPLPDIVDLCLLAVKPQYMKAALPQLRVLKDGSALYLSIAAGISLAALKAALGDVPVIRAMPNTPAAIAKGITALIGNNLVTKKEMDFAQSLLGSIGETVLLDSESQMDAVTALSGSGPAYVFYMIEALVAAGIKEGLPEELATRLATATLSGAGQLAVQSEKSAGQLRVDVTSPAGTTEAGLRELMDADTGLSPLMARVVRAAARRSSDLRDS